MTYEQRLDFIFDGKPDCIDIKKALFYNTLLHNQNRHNERIVMKLCILKLKDYSKIKRIKRFEVKVN